MVYYSSNVCLPRPASIIISIRGRGIISTRGFGSLLVERCKSRAHWTLLSH